MRSHKSKEALAPKEDVLDGGVSSTEREIGSEKVESTLPEGFYLLESIRNKRIRQGKSEYLIKWVDWPESQNTWEPLEHLESCAEDVEAYEQRQRGKKKSGQKRKRCQKRQTPAANVEKEPSSRTDNGNDGSDDEYAIVKIIGPLGSRVFYASDGDVIKPFRCLRRDGIEVGTDNQYLKAQYPQLLTEYYEKRGVDEAIDKD